MIHIFHGDNQGQSRDKFNQAIDKMGDQDVFRLDAKETTTDKVNLILNSSSLFSDQKTLAFTNLFSLPKSITDSLFPLLLSTSQTVIIWQDKSLTPTQLKIFPQAKVDLSPLPKTLFTTLYAIKPNNFKSLIPQLRKTLSSEPFELFLYLLKGHLRKLLTTQSYFPASKLVNAYLSLIELEYQTKSGQLTIPKEVALERVLIQLTSTT